MGNMRIKLQEQRNAEEQERLRVIQLKMEAERKVKEEEEQKVREEEETRRKKVEMETRRKLEEIERLRLEEEDRKAALQLQAQLEKEIQEDSKYRQQLEQERRDHELALRLANESNGQVDDSPPLLRKYVYYFNLQEYCTELVTKYFPAPPINEGFYLIFIWGQVLWLGVNIITLPMTPVKSNSSLEFFFSIILFLICFRYSLILFSGTSELVPNRLIRYLISYYARFNY